MKMQQLSWKYLKRIACANFHSSSTKFTIFFHNPASMAIVNVLSYHDQLVTSSEA